MSLAYVSETLSHFLATPYARYAKFAIAGAVTLLAAPGVMLRYPEASVYLRAHPIRSLLEIVGFSAGFGGLLMDFLGIGHSSTVLSLLEQHIPQAVSQWNAIPALARLGVRAFLSFALYASFSRGYNPLPRAQPSLQGKTVLVTGGTNGLGLYCAENFASLGAKVVIIARDAKRAEECVRKIRVNTLNPSVDYILADQADLKAVAALKSDLEREAPNGFDILLLNAGYAPPPVQELGPSGLEASITTMHLSHQLLVKMLWKNLRPDARIVITASIGAIACKDPEHILAGIRTAGKFEDFPATAYYARAKLANAMLARSLGKLADADPRKIRVSSHHPGSVATNIWNGVQPAWLRFVLNLIANLQMRDSKTGSATMLDAALCPEPLDGEEEAGNGAFYTNSTWISTGVFYQRLIYDQAARDKLWNQTEELIAPFEPASISWN